MSEAKTILRKQLEEASLSSNQPYPDHNQNSGQDTPPETRSVPGLWRLVQRVRYVSGRAPCAQLARSRTARMLQIPEFGWTRIGNQAGVEQLVAHERVDRGINTVSPEFLPHWSNKRAKPAKMHRRVASHPPQGQRQPFVRRDTLADRLEATIERAATTIRIAVKRIAVNSVGVPRSKALDAAPLEEREQNALVDSRFRGKPGHFYTQGGGYHKVLHIGNSAPLEEIGDQVGCLSFIQARRDRDATIDEKLHLTLRGGRIWKTPYLRDLNIVQGKYFPQFILIKSAQFFPVGPTRFLIHKAIFKDRQFPSPFQGARTHHATVESARKPRRFRAANWSARLFYRLRKMRAVQRITTMFSRKLAEPHLFEYILIDVLSIACINASRLEAASTAGNEFHSHGISPSHQRNIRDQPQGRGQIRPHHEIVEHPDQENTRQSVVPSRGRMWSGILAFLACRRIERAAMTALAFAYGVGMPLIYATT